VCRSKDESARMPAGGGAKMLELYTQNMGQKSRLLSKGRFSKCMDFGVPWSFGFVLVERKEEEEKSGTLEIEDLDRRSDNAEC
jgi:hypothetical protein